MHSFSPARHTLALLAALSLAHCGPGGGGTGPDGSMPHGDGGTGGDGTGGGSGACGTTGTTTVGGHWSVATTVAGEESINFAAVWASGPSDVWVVGIQDILHFNGSAWSKSMQMLDLFGVGGSGPNDVWITGLTIPGAGSGGAGMPVMLHATGPTGDPTPSMVSGTEYGNVSMDSATDGWAVGQGAPLHFDGTHWTPMGAGIGAAELLRGVFARSPTDVYAVGQHNYHFDGTTWTQVGDPTDMGFYNAVWSNCAGDVWLGGSQAFVQHYNGTAWAPTPDSPGDDSDDINGMWGAAANDVWAVGNNGRIIHFDGSAWTSVPSGTTQKLASVWGTSASDVWAVGDNGTVLHYTVP